LAIEPIRLTLILVSSVQVVAAAHNFIKNPLHVPAGGDELADGAEDDQICLDIGTRVCKAERVQQAGELFVEAGDGGQIPQELVRRIAPSLP
jgi:hypothetical protein